MLVEAAPGLGKSRLLREAEAFAGPRASRSCRPQGGRSSGTSRSAGRCSSSSPGSTRPRLGARAPISRTGESCGAAARRAASGQTLPEDRRSPCCTVFTGCVRTLPRFARWLSVLTIAESAEPSQLAIPPVPRAAVGGASRGRRAHRRAPTTAARGRTCSRKLLPTARRRWSSLHTRAPRPRPMYCACVSARSRQATSRRPASRLRGATLSSSTASLRRSPGRWSDRDQDGAAWSATRTDVTRRGCPPSPRSHGAAAPRSGGSGGDSRDGADLRHGAGLADLPPWRRQLPPRTRSRRAK